MTKRSRDIMKSDELKSLVLESLEDMKAQDIKALDVQQLTDITDYMIIVSGTSNRHVSSVANRLVADMKAKGIQPFGVEGMESGEWVLIDLVDIVVHVMHPQARELYDLERLWEAVPRRTGDASS